MLFEGEYRFAKKMVADFYEVEERTIERLLEDYADELKCNGYILSRGKHLKKLKLQFAPVINVESKTTQLGLFNFRAVLNVGLRIPISGWHRLSVSDSSFIAIIIDTPITLCSIWKQSSIMLSPVASTKNFSTHYYMLHGKRGLP